jgi:hypothetical protein
VITADVLSEVNLLIGPEVEARVNLYKNTLGTWAKVRIGHVITLKEGDRVFLKGLDVSTCANFDRLLSLSNRQVPNFMNNLRQERAFVRQALQKVGGTHGMTPSDDEGDIKTPCHTERRSQKDKTMGKASIAAPSSDDEIKSPRHASYPVHALPVLPPRKFKRTSHRTMSGKNLRNYPFHIIPPTHRSTSSAPISRQSPVINLVSDDEEPTQPPMHVVKTEPACMQIDLMFSDDEHDEPVTGAMTGAMTSTNIRKCRWSSPSQSLSPSETSDGESAGEVTRWHVTIWPRDFYVMDVVDGFEKCDEACRARINVAKTFTAIFGVPFRRTTFYAHRNLWLEVSQRCRDKFLAARRTPAGLWTAFVECASNKGGKKTTKRIKV